jgi:hypothetical protein
MAVNDRPCQSCAHYDRIVLGDGTRQGRHGWCSTRSTYPAKEAPGQVFPAEVKRAGPGALATPFIVIGVDTITSCTTFRAKS